MKKIIFFLFVIASSNNYAQVLFEKIKPIPPALQNITTFPSIGNSKSAYSDVDLDGDLDMLITGYSSDFNSLTTLLYINNGDGSFVIKPHTIEETVSGSVSFGDVDGDGDEDLFITGYDKNFNPTSKLYLNDSLGNFKYSDSNFFIGVSSSDALFFDANGDSSLDIILMGNSVSSFTTEIYINNGSGKFLLDTNSDFEGFSNGSISAGNIDGVNGLDILITGKSDTSNFNTKLYLNNGTGIFTEQTSNNFIQLANSSSKFADINGNGFLDLFLMGNNSLGEKSTLYTNDGLANFTATTNVFLGLSQGDIEIEEITGGNGLDILISGYDSNSNSITLLYTNDGAGNYSPLTGNNIENLGNGSVQIFDTDGINGKDIFISGKNNNAYSPSLLYMNNGSGVFTEVKESDLIEVDQSSSKFINIDTDSEKELFILGNSKNNNVTSLYDSDGLGNFTKITGNTFLNLKNGDIANGDVDADGDQDIIIIGESDTGSFHTLLYLNNGSGIFTVDTINNFINVAYGSVSFIDIDQINGPDLILSGETNNDSIITNLYTNDGSGIFTKSIDTIVSVTNSTINIADVDGDSDEDLFITGVTQNGLQVSFLYKNDSGNLENSSTTTFQGVQNGIVTFLDLENDSDFDLLVSGIDSSFVKKSIFYSNDGAGNFTQLTIPKIEGLSDGAIDTSDLDLDGDIDFIISGSDNQSNTVTRVFIQDSTGEFLLQRSILDQVISGSIRFDDLDGDSIQDIIITGLTNTGRKVANVYTSSICTPNYYSFSDTVCNTLLSPSGNFLWDYTGIYNDTILLSNGCDSIITVDLIVKSTRDTVVDTVCYSLTSPSGFYTWDKTGEYTDTLINSVSCDSIILFKLTVNVTRDTITDTVCDSFLSPSGKFLWATTGAYADTLINSNDCDSLLYYFLTVNYSYRDTFSLIRCDNFTSPSGKYVWETTGFYSDTLRTSQNCDSIFFYDLEIRQSIEDTIYDTACNFFVGNFGAIWTTSGVYTYSRIGTSGCIEDFVLYLRVNQSSFSVLTITECDSLVSPSGKYAYLNSGTYYDTLTNSQNCDSIIEINLTINNPSSSLVIIMTCDSMISPSGKYTWTTSGLYFDTIINSKNCDSLITINLTINKTIYDTISVSDCGSYISPSGNYNWSVSGTYSDTLILSSSCDSIITIELTIKNSSSSFISIIECDSYTSPSSKFTWSVSGNYLDTILNSQLCDSIISIQLEINRSNSFVQTVFTCDSLISPSGKYIWKNSGTFNDTLLNQSNCDSIITTNLTIGTTNFDSISISNCGPFISPSGKYTWAVSGDYQDTLRTTTGCDSLLYYDLTINPIRQNTVSISGCDSLVSPSGKYAWTTSGTYYDTLSTVNSCDSIVTIHLAISNSYLIMISDTVCDMLTSPSGNFVWINTGIYYDSLKTSSMCDSVYVYDLTVLSSTFITINVVECDSFVSASKKYTWKTSGQYFDTIPNNSGCDSVITYQLTINNSTNSLVAVFSCDSYLSPSGKYTWTTSGMYSDTITNNVGCDSSIIFNLTINSSWIDTLQLTSCDSIFSNGKWIFTTGIYIDSLQTTTLCDSIRVNFIIINKSTNDTIIMKVCDSVTLGDSTYTTTGVYQQILQTASLCDSILVYDITINSSSVIALSDTACDSYNVGTKVYTISGIYSDTLKSIQGCDSIINLDLIINYSKQNDTTIVFCEGDSVQIKGAWYKQNTSVFDTLQTTSGCDSIFEYILSTKSVLPAPNLGLDVQICNNATLQLSPGNYYNSYLWSTGDSTININIDTKNLTVGFNKISVNVYQDSVGCSASDNVIIDVLPCVSSSIIETKIPLSSLNIYPNPTNGEFNIDFAELDGTIYIELRDILGKIVSNKTRINENNIKLNLSSQPSGIYTVTLTNENGRRASFKIVKFLKNG